MKKSTKKTLMALSIILLFGLSTIAFAVLSLTGQIQPNQLKPLASNLVDEPIDPEVEGAYIQSQYTFLRLWYQDQDQLYQYASQLPEIMALPTGEQQLIVNRLAANETRAEIINLNGNIEVENPTLENVFNALCQNLLYTPTDCLLMNLPEPEPIPPQPANESAGPASNVSTNTTTATFSGNNSNQTMG